MAVAITGLDNILVCAGSKSCLGYKFISQLAASTDIPVPVLIGGVENNKYLYVIFNMNEKSQSFVLSLQYTGECRLYHHLKYQYQEVCHLCADLDST